MVGGKSVLSFLAQVTNEWAFLSLLDMLLLLSADNTWIFFVVMIGELANKHPTQTHCASSDLSKLVPYNRDDITQCLYSHVF